jgi:hypothetical protein
MQTAFALTLYSSFNYRLIADSGYGLSQTCGVADGNMSSMTQCLHPTNTPPEIPKISRKLRGTH